MVRATKTLHQKEFIGDLYDPYSRCCGFCVGCWAFVDASGERRSGNRGDCLDIILASRVRIFMRERRRAVVARRCDSPGNVTFARPTGKLSGCRRAGSAFALRIGHSAHRSLAPDRSADYFGRLSGKDVPVVGQRFGRVPSVWSAMSNRIGIGNMRIMHPCKPWIS